MIIEGDLADDRYVGNGLKSMAKYRFRFEDGQGVGNQLWCYLALRSIVTREGGELTFSGAESFKVQRLFPKTDFSTEFVNSTDDCDTATEMIVYAHGVDFPTRCSIEHVLEDQGPKRTHGCLRLHGLFQNERYLLPTDRLRFFLRWELNVSGGGNPNHCLIHVRGGDYLGVPASLPRRYYQKAVNFMRVTAGVDQFFVVTNDRRFADFVLPGVRVIGSIESDRSVEHTNAAHHIGGDIVEDFWLLANARYVILSNSTFAYWPVRLGKAAVVVVAPLFWFAYNVSRSWWSPSDSVVDDWYYVHHRFPSLVQRGSEINVGDTSPFARLVVWLYKLVFRLRRKALTLLRATDLSGLD